VMQNAVPEADVACMTTVVALVPVMPTLPTVVPALSHGSDGSTASAFVQLSTAAPQPVFQPVYVSPSVKNVFAAASALALPIASGGMDFVVAADGIYSWNLESRDRNRCLGEIHRILVASGRVLFTEHTRAFRFAEFVAEIERHDFEIERVDYLYDRPWYQVESWFKMLQGTSWVRSARRSDAIARFLQRVGRVFGPRASRHVCVLARKRTTQRVSYGAR